MQLALFLATTLFAVVSPGLNAEDHGDGGSCQLPTPVEAFSASVYTALVVSTDPKILHSLELPGGEAAQILYKNIETVLEDYDLCDAEVAAFSAARGLAHAEKETVLDYFKKATIAFGKVLYDNGVLSCDNDVSLSLSLYTYIKKALEGRDPSTFDTQMYGTVKGIVDLYYYLRLNLEDVTQQTSDTYAQEYLDNDKCKAKAAHSS